MSATLIRENIDSLRPDGKFPLSDLVISALAQQNNSEVSSRLDSLMYPQGKVISRAKPEKKVVPVVSADALVGDEQHVTRPNGEKYHVRKWGEHDDVQVLRKAREQMQFILLYGSPGCGKTALVQAALPDSYAVLGTGDTELSDLIGSYIQTPSGGFLWEDGPLVKAAEEGRPLFIDEVGLIDPKVLSGVYSLMDGTGELTITANPERGTIKAKEGFYVIAATNPNAPGVRLSEALLSRFTIQVEMTTDWTLAKKLGASQQIVTVAQNLNRRQQTGEVGWCPQMRELLAFRDISKIYGTTFAIQNLIACAPDLDRAIVSDVLTRVFGQDCRPAKI